MYKKVVFFNYYHNGDIHLSRGFIKKIIEKVKQISPDTTFYYAHKNSPDLLADIEIAFDPTGLSIIGNDHANLVVRGDTIYINTWYAQQHFKYMNVYGISMDTLYMALNDSCKAIWGFSLEDISKDPSVFFPSIDYTKYQITEAHKWLNNHPEKKIFVSNGNTLSGQAHNFAMTPILIDIAQKHTDKTFILSNKENINVPSNIFWSSDIIRKAGCDLNENGFLTEHCDLIVGRSSGAFTFSQTQNNFFKRNTSFLNICNLVPKQEGKFWLDTLMQHKITYTSKIKTIDTSYPDQVKILIEGYL